MKVGLLSDTHGHLGRTYHAAKLFHSEGIGAVIHCGDIGTAAVLIELSVQLDSPPVEIYAVLGNVDQFNAELYPFSQAERVTVFGTKGELTLADQRIAIIHGHESDELDAALAAQTFALVLTGHTHQATDRRVGKTRLINPGALYRSANPTVAILNLLTGQLDYHPIT